MKKINAAGFAHMGILIIFLALLITGSIAGVGYVVYNNKNKSTNASTSNTPSNDEEAASLDLNKEPAEETITVSEFTEENTVNNEPAENPSTNPQTPQQQAASEPLEQPNKGPFNVRLRLANSKELVISLLKGGDSGYYTPECTKGGGDEVLPIVTIRSEAPDIRVRLCSNHILPTTSPKSGISRLSLADGAYIDTSVSKGGSPDGYQPATNCTKGGGSVGQIIKVQTSIDVRQLELCGEHKLIGEAF